MAERNYVRLTITMSKEEKKALRQAALDKDMSASELFHNWITEYWKKEKEAGK